MLSERPKRQSNQDSTVGLFVALYMILLAFFIVLTKDLSFDHHKKTVAMRSLHESFGRPMEQPVVFGSLSQVTLEQYALEIEAITKDFGKVYTNLSEDIIKLRIPLKNIYFADEINFKDERIADMTRLVSILQRWQNTENIAITVQLSETDFKKDQKRLVFFSKNLSKMKNLVGIELDNNQELEFIIEVKQ